VKAFSIPDVEKSINALENNRISTPRIASRGVLATLNANSATADNVRNIHRNMLVKYTSFVNM
jgi:hypothetical protein